MYLWGDKGGPSLLQLVIDDTAPGLDLRDEVFALLDLLQEVLDRPIEHVTLGAALALESRDDGGQLVEAVADGLAALLLCSGSAVGLANVPSAGPLVD